MEIRAKNKNKKLNIPWKILLMGIVLGLLAGGFAWGNGRKTVQAGPKYDMEKENSTTSKLTFNVVEVVPDKSQAMLGMYLPGWENSDRGAISDLVKPRTSVNNASISPYQNLHTEENKNALNAFDNTYEVVYKAVTPGELAQLVDSGSKIHYLHIGGGIQSNEYKELYNAIHPIKMSSVTSFNSNGTDRPGDISYAQALALYNRVLEDKMAVSIDAHMMRNTKTDNNLYKFYQMLNYADNPRNFKQVFQGNAEGKYIDQNGAICQGNKTKMDWSDENLATLKWKKIPTVITDHDKKDKNSLRSEQNYIPAQKRNVLIYNQLPGSFCDAASLTNIKTIINFNNQYPGSDPGEEDEGDVKVLEIEPCNHYWLSANQNNLAILARAMGVSEEDISVTYATPNRLNGMAVDLAAEYDAILIGDNVDLFRKGSDQAAKIYTHIGTIKDAVVPQTLINGLLENDHTTEARFNQLTAPPLDLWGPSMDYFLKNVEVALKLDSSNDAVSRARFSGNDLNRNMQEQLAEFVNSGQPVVVDPDVRREAEGQIRDFNSWEIWGDSTASPNPSQDSRLYFALCGMSDEQGYYDSKKTIEVTTILDKQYDLDKVKNNQQPISLKKSFKPSIEISDTETMTNEAGDVISTIVPMGAVGEELSGLGKSNIVSFDYDITIPQGDRINNTVMKVIFDRNGDGIFDEMVKNQKPDKKGNATGTIKEDKVYTYEFPPKDADTIYHVKKDGLETEIEGRFTTPEPVEAIEEFCEFRVLVSTKDEANKLRGSWTGYMRPELQQSKQVRILQIMPFSATVGGKPLSQNSQFKQLITEANTLAGESGEYVFAWDHTGFESMSEGDFQDQCKSKTITAETLKANYDLIIAGTDFNTPDVSDTPDIEEEAADVLKKYAEEYKCPIIFTNDFISYVNSNNYFTPVSVPTGENAYALGNVVSIHNNTIGRPFLYTGKNVWNYMATQSLRYTLGMDRFAVTTDIEPEEKRDKGSSRRYGKTIEIQGFTDGALLEYAYVPNSPGTKVDSRVNTNSIYADSELALGTRPRTDVIERFNDGIIAHYPFEIGDLENTSETEVLILTNHTPYYQLDLERDLGEGKIDDVTVWYTLAGKDVASKDVASKYFEVTRKDAGNNYYLYSKGKMYYTGFSLHDTVGEENSDPQLIPDSEMKLFINTIYAALSGTPVNQKQNICEAVVKAVGSISNISRSEEVGKNNQYVCYYDEYESSLNIRFRIQKNEVGAQETTPILLGLKTPAEAGGSAEPIKIDLLPSNSYQLPEGMQMMACPIEPTPEGESDPGLTQDSGSWYELVIPFGSEGMNQMALDGRTLVIAVADELSEGEMPAAHPKTNAIHAEIRLVMRTMFDLD